MLDQKNSLKESFLFKKIDWMMAEFDLPLFCERMGWKIDSETSQHIVTFCPDHHLYTGREPSHPKFYIDKKTGQTQCKTEGRGSNLVWTVRRLLNCHAQDAYKFIVGAESLDSLDGVSWKVLKRRIEETDIEEEEDEEQHTFAAESFAELKLEISKGIIHDTGYNYFLYPPLKKPTLIDKSTVKHFKCFQRDYGYFKDRVFVPVYLEKSLTGFVAIDILGEERNKKLYPEMVKYKKVLYPKGFKSGKNLFNYDEVENGADYIIIVEGVRDVMKLWQLGYKNVIAIFGTNISSEQCVLISQKYPTLCYIMLDGDDAGIQAATKIAKKLCRFIDTKVAIPPRGEDPKTLAKDLVDKTLSKARLITS